VKLRVSGGSLSPSWNSAIKLLLAHHQPLAQAVHVEARLEARLPGMPCSAWGSPSSSPANPFTRPPRPQEQWSRQINASHCSPTSIGR
jgi:hypothetical protein